MNELRPEKPILIVDDEDEILFTYRFALKSAGLGNSVTSNSGLKALDLIKEQRFSLIILDLHIPDMQGDEILEFVSKNYPETPVIIVTAANDAEIAVRCLRMGAEDFILKPVDKLRFITTVKNCLEKNALKKRVMSFTGEVEADELENPEIFSDIITKSSKMFSIFKYMESVATSCEPVLVTGETGVGKELFTKVVHDLSKRSGKFVAVNIAGLDDNMFSDTLFGHSKGAFTGAGASRKGLIQEAAGGTLFLDEIGDLSEQSQVKLLRLLQDGTYMPLGSDKTEKTDARIITATNADLKTMIEQDKFRKDLYYRLITHRINIPPLRERLDDIVPLFTFFLDEAVSENRLKEINCTESAASVMKNYSFPGNVREMRAIVYDLAARSEGEIRVYDIKKYMESTGRKLDNSKEANRDGEFRYAGSFPTLKEMEGLLVTTAIEMCEGNQSQAAKLLGISRQALNKRVNK